ncbi:hypothetical protein D9M68_745430 [compost metagenome]
MVEGARVIDVASGLHDPEIVLLRNHDIAGPVMAANLLGRIYRARVAEQPGAVGQGGAVDDSGHPHKREQNTTTMSRQPH